MILLLSCAKDGGQGLPGSKGENGAQGSQGETGTANVIYSDWFTLDFGETPINEPSAFDFILTDEFTQEIKDSGLIMVYGRKDFSTGYKYYPLPYTRITTLQHYEFTLSENFEDLLIWVRSFDGTNIIFPDLTEFRYIIVPGGIPASGKVSSKNYTKMTYDEITELFSIPK